MDSSTLFYRTNYFCSFHGVASNSSCKYRAMNLWRRFVVTLMVFFSLFSYYRVAYAVFCGTHSLIDCLRTIMSIVTLKTLYDLEVNFARLNVSICSVLKYLPQKYMGKIHKFDFIFCFTLILGELISVCSMCYAFATGQFNGFRAFFVGPADMKSSDLVIFILALQYNFSIGCIILSSVLYIEIQVLMGYHCLSLNDSLLTKDVIVLDELIRNCRCINRIRHLLNKSFGFIPFALIVSVWFFFVFSLSFAHTYDSIKYNRLTVAAVILLIICGILLLEMLVRATCFFDQKAHELRESCSKLTGKSEMCAKTRQFRMACILNDFLLNEKLPPMMAYGTIKIRPSLSLAVIDSMVTFTALVSTSFRVYIK